jgi:hypothetical protein
MRTAIDLLRMYGRREVRYIMVRSVKGVVELDGYASADRGRTAIEGPERAAPDVPGVRNGLHTFEMLSEHSCGLQSAAA